MEPELIRTYYSSGTNGKSQYQNRLMMYSIEPSWKDDPAQVTCIPERRYEGIKRWSPKFNRHLQVMNESQRENMLIHPVNDAMHELKAVSLWSVITGVGKRICFPPQAGQNQHDHVFINIKSDPYESV